jgi:signal transduction histidine kinase
MRQDEPRGCGRRSRARHGRRSAASAGAERWREPASEAVPLTPDERAWREAQAAAEDKVAAASDAIRWSVITIALLVFLPPVGLCVLIFGGAKQLRALFRLVIEPKLRSRFIGHEVTRRVSQTLSSERQQLVGEHARSMEMLSASIAHEIRNPITAAKSLVQQMEEDPTAPDNVEYARVALEELNRVDRSVSHLLRFAREEEMGIGDVRMADVIDSALETFRERLSRGGIELVRELDGEGALRGDAEQLRRVIINLVGNAIEALDESRTPGPRIEIALGEDLAGARIWVRVRDNGPGIDAEALKKMFSPFYTSKVNGTGLGLAISRKLVEAHHGTLEASSRPGGGAEFLVTLPRQLAAGGAP